MINLWKSKSITVLSYKQYNACFYTSSWAIIKLFKLKSAEQTCVEENIILSIVLWQVYLEFDTFINRV